MCDGQEAYRIKRKNFKNRTAGLSNILAIVELSLVNQFAHVDIKNFRNP